MLQAADANGVDAYTQFATSLEQAGCLGTATLDVTEATGLTVLYKAPLSAGQAQLALLDAQEADDYANGKLSYEPTVVIE
eukprot:4675976-Prymnesium_polylepis.1